MRDLIGCPVWRRNYRAKVTAKPQGMSLQGTPPHSSLTILNKSIETIRGMEYSLAINSSRYTAGLTVSNPKIASGSYFLRVNKIIHDGGIYKTTLLSLTIITTPEL